MNVHIEKCKICGKEPQVAAVGATTVFHCCTQYVRRKLSYDALMAWNEAQKIAR